MGGTLEASSQLGSGSTFVLSLPAGLGPVHEPVPEFAGDGAILIVDDEDASRYVCRQMFRGSRHRFIESNGFEAAERARFERPRLIILDLIMPGRTGFEILDELKSDPATAGIPIVIHTSKTLTKADQARLGGRHLGLLPKSGLDRKETLLAIREVLREPTLFLDEPEFAGSDGKEEGLA
jgi:CheY-like chemotaxis protein